MAVLFWAGRIVYQITPNNDGNIVMEDTAFNRTGIHGMNLFATISFIEKLSIDDSVFKTDNFLRLRDLRTNLPQKDVGNKNIFSSSN